MKYDEVAKNHKLDASDFTADDVVSWLEQSAATELDGGWFQLSADAKGLLAHMEQSGKELKAWDLLVFSRSRQAPAPCAAAIAEFKAAEARNELSKEHVPGLALISFLKRTKFEDLLTTVDAAFNSRNGEFDDQLMMSAWDAFRWLMADGLNNQRFEAAAAPHEHLTPTRAQ